MQKNNHIKIGDRIELLQTKSTFGRKVSDKKYTSQLLDYDGIRTLKISVPFYEGRVVPLDMGDEYELRFYTAKGMYQCRAKVLRRYMEMKIHVVEMQMITELTKYQRRQFYRLDCRLKFQYRVVTEEERALSDLVERNEFTDAIVQKNFEEKLKAMRQEWYEAQMTDISGGGLRFQCTEELERQVHIEVKISLDTGTELRVVCCKAVVIDVVPGVSQGREYIARCQFDEIDKNTQELIVKYIFEEQKRRIRKD